MARSVLDSGDAPGKVKPHLLSMADVETLCGHGGGTHETANGTVLTPSQVRLNACDCAISRVVFGPDSQPLDIGRASRVIPPSLARAVIARDRHCQHPGCGRPARWCDIHHLIHWVDGGPTAIWNLILLCGYHHTFAHWPAARTEDANQASKPPQQRGERRWPRGYTQRRRFHPRQ